MPRCLFDKQTNHLLSLPRLACMIACNSIISPSFLSFHRGLEQEQYTIRSSHQFGRPTTWVEKAMQTLTELWQNLTPSRIAITSISHQWCCYSVRHVRWALKASPNIGNRFPMFDTEHFEALPCWSEHCFNNLDQVLSVDWKLLLFARDWWLPKDEDFLYCTVSWANLELHRYGLILAHDLPMPDSAPQILVTRLYWNSCF